jgi:CheY-like chemotaxis protein/HPt (histidine-containing phosphotransfer) domain-containing protein
MRILIVDDNATNREILAAQLTGWRFRYSAVASGAEALEQLEEAAAAGSPFRLAILDMQMPEMDGLQLIREIKARTAIRDTMLVMLTSMGQILSSGRMDELGLADCLPKPVRQSRLFDTIVEAVSAKGSRKTHAPQVPAPAAPAPERCAGRRILLAEDNEINQLVASSILTQFGYECRIVAHGEAAVEAVRSGEFDLVLMDCQMPGMDGFEATRTIRREEQLASAGRLPIVALTANAIKGDRERCLNAGMDGYVTKPIDTLRLIETIETLLAAAQQEDGPARSEQSPQRIADRDGRPSHGELSPADEAHEAGREAIDLDSLLERCLGDADLCRRVLRMFADGLATQRRQIDDAAAAADMRLLANAAHALKGSAGDVSAFPLWEAAAELEQLARNGQHEMPDSASLAAAYCRLDLEVRRSLQAATLRLKEPAAPQANAAETTGR